jgi:hypothetical protein
MNEEAYRKPTIACQPPTTLLPRLLEVVELKAVSQPIRNVVLNPIAGTSPGRNGFTW